MQVSTNDTGFYHLTVFSQAFSRNYSIVFGIVVNLRQEIATNATPICSSENTYWIVGTTVLGVLLLLSLLVIGFLLQKLRGKTEKTNLKGCTMDLIKWLKKSWVSNFYIYHIWLNSFHF